MIFVLQAKKPSRNARAQAKEVTAVAKTDKDLSFEELLEKHRADQRRHDREVSEESGRSEDRSAQDEAGPVLAEARPVQAVPKPAKGQRKVAKSVEANRSYFSLSSQAERDSKEQAGEDCLLIQQFRQLPDTLCNGLSSLHLEEKGMAVHY